MNEKLLEEIKQSLKGSLHKYIGNFQYRTAHPLDLLIPNERKIRSIVGGLETSMGTTVWEPIAKTLARNNGFTVIEEKILKPDPMPEALAVELGTLTTLRENRTTWIGAEECKRRLKEVCLSVNRDGVSYIPPASGSGVDIFLKKAGRFYAFDTKTVQPNVGDIKKFNKQILEWYAYSLCKDPEIDIKGMIAYPYNPYASNFWEHTPHTGGILEPRVDALVENEFWDLLSGQENTYQIILKILVELNLEGFGKELSAMIEKINSPVENVV